MSVESVIDRFGRVWARDGTAFVTTGLAFDLERELDDAEATARCNNFIPGDWVEPKTPEQIIADLKNAVQAHLDATAQADDWDNIYTASLRASFAGPYQARGVKYAKWMDACWLRCHEIEAQVFSGQRAVPTPDELIAALPLFE